MNLSSLAVKRPITILMMVLVIVLLGAVSFSRLPVDLLPAIEYPIAIVSTRYSGVGPQEVENLVTKPLEGAIASVGNIENINSISSQGNSIIIARFNFGTDMDLATIEMREKVDLIKGSLPDDVSDPMVLKLDPNAQPIIQLSISGSSEEMNAIQDLVEETFKPRLERLDGVASVDIMGGYEQEIEVKVNSSLMEGYGLNMNQLAQIMGASNLNLPGGMVERGSQELTVRAMGEFKTIEEIKKVPLILSSGTVIALEDIAEINLKNKEVNQISRSNGKESIIVSIQKQSGKNTVQTASLVNKEIEQISNDYPDVEISVVMDLSTYVTKAIEGVFQNAIFGSLLAIAILYLFLRNIRTTFIIGTSIPISIIATFILLYFNGITLNLMSLGGLALGVGMLVDNAIVVLENIYRFRSEGYSKKDAAIKGASEVAMAVTASTLTTVAVFIPIVFVQGITSTIFKELAMTVSLSLGASLLVSLTLIPMLSSKILKVEEKTTRKPLGHRVYQIFDNIFKKIEERYRKVLGWSLRHRVMTVAISIIIFIVSLASLVFVGAEFFPAMDEGQINISVSLPAGSHIDETKEIVEEIEEKINDIPEVDILFSNIKGAGNNSMLSGGQGNGNITVMLLPLADRKRGTQEIADEIRYLVKDIPGGEISVSESSSAMGGLGGAPINITIKGDDLDTLEDIAEDFKDIVASVEGTREVKTSLSEGVPEVQVSIDKNMAANYGLTAAQIANSVKGSLSGMTVTKYKQDGKEIDLVLREDSLGKESLSNLAQIHIPTPAGGTIPLNQIADIKMAKGPIEISRENQQRIVTVSGQLIGRDLRSAAEEIDGKLKEYYLPQGYYYELGGQNKELNDAFADLSLALIMAVLLIYMVLAAQFESLLHPFTIILSVPLAFGGGALGLFITGRTLNVPSLIGAVMLAGIVVNNAIVLVDYINTLREKGTEKTEAIMIAGPVRLRPIMMTTLTTVLGLVPLAMGIGEGAETQAPLATVVIGGLLLSTLLTLLLIPVVYTLIDDLGNKIKNKLTKNRSQQSFS